MILVVPSLIQLSAVDYIALQAEVKATPVELRLAKRCERTKNPWMTDQNHDPQPVSVVILAGGQSRRMGQDKSLLRVGSRTLLEIVAGRVRPLGEELFVVARERPEYAKLGFRVVPDHVPGSGSLGGILTALTVARYDRCLVVGCDMPFLNRALLRYMCRLPFDYDVLVPVQVAEESAAGSNRRYETMHAVYGRAALPVIEARIQQGALKVADMLADVRVREIDEATVRRFDPELRSFFNANTPADFTYVEQLIERDTNNE